MKFTDQFTIRLTSSQHELLTDIFSSCADLDLPPTEDEYFNDLWDKILDAQHEILTS